MASITQRLEEIAQGCDDCAKDADDAARLHEAGAKGEARAWRATALMIRAVVKDLSATPQ